jgi:hypothetical protein
VCSLWMPFPAGVGLRRLAMWPPGAWYDENALPQRAQGRGPDCADADGCGAGLACGGERLRHVNRFSPCLIITAVIATKLE